MQHPSMLTQISTNRRNIGYRKASFTLPQQSSTQLSPNVSIDSSKRTAVLSKAKDELLISSPNNYSGKQQIGTLKHKRSKASSLV